MYFYSVYSTKISKQMCEHINVKNNTDISKACYVVRLSERLFNTEQTNILMSILHRGLDWC